MEGAVKEVVVKEVVVKEVVEVKEVVDQCLI
jgi:hypothetical protein